MTKTKDLTELSLKVRQGQTAPCEHLVAASAPCAVGVNCIGTKTGRR